MGRIIIRSHSGKLPHKHPRDGHEPGGNHAFRSAMFSNASVCGHAGKGSC